MSAPILATKLYVPRPQPEIVPRSRLVERLYEGLHRRLTLVSAAAGFGKTTLLGEWVACSGRPVAWLSLDDEDFDPVRFLAYLAATLQTVGVGIWLTVRGFDSSAAILSEADRADLNERAKLTMSRA